MSTRTWRPRACSRISSTRPRSAAGSCSRRAARPSAAATDPAGRLCCGWPGLVPAIGVSRAGAAGQGAARQRNLYPPVAPPARRLRSQPPSYRFDPMTPSRDIARLIDIMAALRTPGSGCPWDLEQSFATIAPYTIEEAYEVADAIVRGDLDDLRDELGDLLLQVIFHAR